MRVRDWELVKFYKLPEQEVKTFFERLSFIFPRPELFVEVGEDGEADFVWIAWTLWVEKEDSGWVITVWDYFKAIKFFQGWDGSIIQYSHPSLRGNL